VSSTSITSPSFTSPSYAHSTIFMSSGSHPYLLAVLLITQRTGSEAQVVFHYPPHPLSDQQSDPHQHRDVASDANSSSDSDGDSSSDDNDFQAFLRRTKPQVSRHQLHDHKALLGKDNEHHLDASMKSSNQRQARTWEPLLGLGEEGLASLLAPGRAWHKRKFEMSINDLVFLGRPVYARASGTWHHRRRATSKNQVEDDMDTPSDTATGSEQGERTKALPRNHSRRKSPLAMFHVVFVMNPPPLEHSAKVKEMYDNVARKLSRILKWEQTKNQYVWKESDLMSNTKQLCLARKASTSNYYAEVLAQSSLATAISTIFKSISASRIAAVTLHGEVNVSLQIPPVTSVSYLPSLNDPPIRPGLWITTANDSPLSHSDLDTASASGALQLAKQFSLLLKESPQKILKEVQATGGPLAMPLANFINKARPTKSFHKISLANRISLADIQLLARHLIYWRRAIAVPPLHHRDTYIVSPNADMSNLIEASKAFETAFPMMPSLPRILNLLSQVPSPFGMLIPSSDHKEEYYRVLAWLMRGGWLTQLRTFAHIRIDPNVKKASRDHARETRSRTTTSSPEKPPPDSEVTQRRPSILSRPSSEGHQSISTETSHSQSTQKANTSSASMPITTVSSLILSPLRATTLESRHLAYLSDSLRTQPSIPSTSTKLPSSIASLSPADKAELHNIWPALIKYFNGMEPLEMIPIREGLKRKAVWDVLGKLGLDFEGSVMDERRENKNILVTVRHW
jgi:nitrogen permease regulator 3-like protein